MPCLLQPLLRHDTLIFAADFRSMPLATLRCRSMPFRRAYIIAYGVIDKTI